MDISTEKTIPLSQVPNFVPKRNGKKVHYSTVYRWITKGSRGRVLESIAVGGIRYTSVEAVRRFLQIQLKPNINSVPSVGDAIEHALRDAGV